MFNQSKAHDLPRFPPGASGIFHSHCEDLSPEDVPQLRDELKEAYLQLINTSKELSVLDVHAVAELFDRSMFLLDEYSFLNPSQRSLVIGAIRYFVDPEDGLPDLEFATGFDDDVKVMNHVLEELGFSDRCIAVE